MTLSRSGPGYSRPLQRSSAQVHNASRPPLQRSTARVHDYDSRPRSAERGDRDAWPRSPQRDDAHRSPRLHHSDAYRYGERHEKIVVGHHARPFPPALAWTRPEFASRELSVESNDADEEIVAQWASGLRDGCRAEDKGADGARKLASWARSARSSEPPPAWDADPTVDHAALHESGEQPKRNTGAAALNRLGRRWRSESKVDSGLSRRKRKSGGAGRGADPDDAPARDERAVATLKAVLAWHKRCDQSTSGGGAGPAGAKPWAEKRDWECSQSPLAKLRRRARALTRAFVDGKGAESTEDAELWRQQMATNYKEGNLDLADLSDASSLVHTRPPRNSLRRFAAHRFFCLLCSRLCSSCSVWRTVGWWGRC